jgi:hypothetical protein
VGTVVLLVRRSGAVLNGALLPGEADARVAASAGRCMLTRMLRPVAAAPRGTRPWLNQYGVRQPAPIHRRYSGL